MGKKTHNMKLTPSTRKKLLIGAAVLLLILIITNPSISSFKAFRGSNTYLGLERPANLFICSVYRDYDSNRYLGIVGNFFDITPSMAQPAIAHVEEPKIEDFVRADSSIHINDYIKLPIPEFANKIKTKYPEYKDINDTILVTKILEKYPVYKENVDLR